ncbi:MAG: dipeptidase, partial [Chthoniobacterales bacterium]
QQCEALGVIIDLAHLNPAGFDEVASMTKKPLIISHTNARKFYDIERNSSDAQIKLIGERGGVVGVNTILVSPRKEEATLDCYIDHIEHIAGLIGIGAVAIGFDFFEFIYQQWSELTQQVFRVRYPDFHFVPNLKNHSHAKNLTRRLMERGFTDEQIEKILFRNWMRVFEELL